MIARLYPSPSSFRRLARQPSAVALMVILLLLVVPTACVTTPSPELSAIKKTPTMTEALRPTETATPYVVATAWTAELIGRLDIVEGCVRVIDRVDGDSRLLVWPPDFEVTVGKDNVRVIGGKVTGIRTEVLLHDGEMVLLGGGETSKLNEQLQSSVPSHCPGPYWVFGSYVGPYPAASESNP